MNGRGCLCPLVLGKFYNLQVTQHFIHLYFSSDGINKPDVSNIHLSVASIENLRYLANISLSEVLEKKYSCTVLSPTELPFSYYILLFFLSCFTRNTDTSNNYTHCDIKEKLIFEIGIETFCSKCYCWYFATAPPFMKQLSLFERLHSLNMADHLNLPGSFNLLPSLHLCSPPLPLLSFLFSTSFSHPPPLPSPSLSVSQQKFNEIK